MPILLPLKRHFQPELTKSLAWKNVFLPEICVGFSEFLFIFIGEERERIEESHSESRKSCHKMAPLVSTPSWAPFYDRSPLWRKILNGEKSWEMNADYKRENRALKEPEKKSGGILGCWKDGEVFGA